MRESGTLVCSWLAAVAFILLAATPVTADQVSGTVTNTGGTPVAYARVILFDPTLATFLEARTNPWRSAARRTSTHLDGSITRPSAN